MSYLHTNRKKVRGWKRRVRQLERFAQTHSRLDPVMLEERERQYVKLWIDPWDRFVKRNPPVWYRRLALAAMAEIYQKWEEQLRGTGEPFYLALWLYHPRFHETQVVAAIGGMLGFYEKTFTPRALQPLPQEFLANQSFNADLFDWQTCSDDDYIFEEPEYMTESEIARLVATAAETTVLEEDGESRRLFSIRRGVVWVGRPVEH